MKTIICPAMIHSDYYIEINICFVLRKLIQNNSFAQLSAFPPAQIKIEDDSRQFFSGVNYIDYFSNLR